jgi:hypothetical protein
MNKYFINKLKEKVNTRRELDGLPLYDDRFIKNILKYKEVGRYEIIWSRDNDMIDLVLINNKIEVEQFNGRYKLNIKNTFNNNVKLTLFSSEYIEFSLEELREFNLNRILKPN